MREIVESIYSGHEIKLGVRFLGIHEIKNGIRRQAPDSHVIDYEMGNHFVLKMSNTIKIAPAKQKDRTPKDDSPKNNRELLHVVKSDMCDKQLCARKEFWKVCA